MDRDSSVLVTGAGGQVGRALREQLPDARFMTRAELDVTDPVAVATAVHDYGVVVHLAAMTDVDGCETQPDLAAAINDRGTRAIADAAANIGARVIYVSTDYVFDGSKETPYDETDEPAPLNVYGKTKLAGERHVSAAERNLVVRTSWVFGEGHNFVRTILRLAPERDEISVVDDQKGRPTAAVDLATALAELIDREATGVVHATGSGAPCTWADVAERIVEVGGMATKIRRVSTTDYAAIAGRKLAPRPMNSALSTDRLKAWGIELPPWDRSLANYLGTTA